MSATLKMKKWRDNFLQIPEGLRGHPMSELEEDDYIITRRWWKLWWHSDGVLSFRWVWLRDLYYGYYWRGGS